jgi:hypothetical protein
MSVKGLVLLCLGAGSCLNYKKDIILEFAKHVLLPLERKLLAMWERIGEALIMVCIAYPFAVTWY